MISYLEGRTAEERDQPFFAYLPFSAPHWPLQAPADTCAKYKGRYESGPEVLRQERVARLKKLGLVPDAAVAHSVVTTGAEPESWESLDDYTRASSARAMEVYAAMVERMDWNIGKVIEFLRESGEYDNTMIMFMSDNGAEGASYEASPLVGTSIMEHVNKYYDNSLDNIGRGDSFVWYGPLWAQAATAPSRLYKMFSTEGGCRVPLVVKPHAGLNSSSSGPAAKSKIVDAFCTVMDIVPTFLDFAGLQHPGNEYKGRKVASLRGRSWRSYLENLHTVAPQKSIHASDYVAGFEIAGSGALRRGDWKITFVPAPKGPQRWELFNLAADPGETRDLREDEPEIFQDLLRLWEDYRRDVGVVGLAGEFDRAVQGAQQTTLQDEMDDPYAWIKYIGRPSITPKELAPVVPTV
jgi:arylsulfatase